MNKIKQLINIYKTQGWEALDNFLKDKEDVELLNDLEYEFSMLKIDEEAEIEKIDDRLEDIEEEKEELEEKKEKIEEKKDVFKYIQQALESRLSDIKFELTMLKFDRHFKD